MIQAESIFRERLGAFLFRFSHPDLVIGLALCFILPWT